MGSRVMRFLVGERLGIFYKALWKGPLNRREELKTKSRDWTEGSVVRADRSPESKSSAPISHGGLWHCL